MTSSTQLTKDTHEHGQFLKARIEARHMEGIQRTKAVRTVAGHSIDVEDCTTLLSMLGLDPSDPAE